MTPCESTIRRRRRALELNRLQLLRVFRLRRNGTHLHDDARVIKNENKINNLAQGNTTTHLGLFERVDQTAFANVGEANDTDGDALRRAWFVRLEETE